MDIENSFALDKKNLGDRREVRKTDLAVDPILAHAIGSIKNEAISSLSFDNGGIFKETIKRDNGPKVYANDIGLNDPSTEAEDTRNKKLEDRKEEVCKILANILYERVKTSMTNNRPDDCLFDYLNGGEAFTKIDRDELTPLGVALRPTKNDTMSGWIDNDLVMYLTEKLKEIAVDGVKPFADSEFKVAVMKADPFSLLLQIKKLN